MKNYQRTVLKTPHIMFLLKIHFGHHKHIWKLSLNISFGVSPVTPPPPPPPPPPPDRKVRTEPDVTHFVESLWYILYDRYTCECISGFQKTPTAAFYPGDWRTSCWHWCSSELAPSNDMWCLRVMQQPEESNQQVWARAHLNFICNIWPGKVLWFCVS